MSSNLSFPILYTTNGGNVREKIKAVEAWLSGSSPEEVEKRLGASRFPADSSGDYTHWVWERISRTHFIGWEYSASPEKVQPGHTFPAGRYSITHPTGRFKIEKA